MPIGETKQEVAGDSAVDPNEHPRLEYAEYLWNLQLPRHLRAVGVGLDGEEVELALSPTARHLSKKASIELGPESLSRAASLGRASSLPRANSLRPLTPSEANLEEQIASGGLRQDVNEVRDVVIPTPHFWDGFRYMREATFGVALGVSAAPGAWNMANRSFDFYDTTTADRLGLIGAVVGMLNLVFYIPKVFLFTKDVREVLDHPTASSAFGLCGMALMTASGGYYPYSETLSTVSTSEQPLTSSKIESLYSLCGVYFWVG